jgi:hypothetical protein
MEKEEFWYTRYAAAQNLPADCATGGVRGAIVVRKAFVSFDVLGGADLICAPYCETLSLKEMRILKGRRAKIALMKI